VIIKINFLLHILPSGSPKASGSLILSPSPLHPKPSPKNMDSNPPRSHCGTRVLHHCHIAAFCIFLTGVCMSVCLSVGHAVTLGILELKHSNTDGNAFG